VTRAMRNHSRQGIRGLSLLIVGALFAGVLAMMAPAAGAADALANLKITADNVEVKLKGKASFADAKDGQALKQGDTIKTDANGRAEIDYTDGSITRLGASTVFTISKLTNEKGARQTQGTLSVGETWNRAAKVSETGSFEVKAGGTTAAVEGTAFVAKCVPDTSGSQEVDCTFTAVVDDIKVGSDLWDVASVTDSQ
jgi:FecR protein